MMTTVLAATLVVGCEGRPDRPPLDDFPAVSTDSDVVPVPNTCETLAHPFSVDVDGYIEGSYSGFATYEYRSVPDQRTSVTLTVCDGIVPLGDKLFTLHFYGVARVEAGTYSVSRDAPVEGGVVFSFADDSREIPVNCGDLPLGSITFDRVTVGELSGSFDITSRCIDETLQDEERRPQEARFRGTFSANNIGPE